LFTGAIVLQEKLTISFLLILFLIAFSACSSMDQAQQSNTASTARPTAASDNANAAPMRMGPGGGMMARHHAQIPDEYAGLTNLVPADEDSLLRGKEIYEQYCSTCHGEGGMGDGLAGQQLDPQPAPVAHTARMLGDDYLFWRISEGGGHEPFSSAMPQWQDVLNDTDRWDVINYIRALGSGQALPDRGPGAGETFDPAAEALRHEQMAAEGVDRSILSREEADAFVSVHAELDLLMASETTQMRGGMEARQQEMLARLVSDGTITQKEADLFTSAHDKLVEAGLMQ
jgi:mono/diheme cytochrome c family protein